MSKDEYEKIYDVKFKCKNCGCTLWHLFGDGQDFWALFSADQEPMPMCVKCGAFPWFEPGDENGFEIQNIFGFIKYLIKEALHHRGDVKHEM